MICSVCSDLPGYINILIEHSGNISKNPVENSKTESGKLARLSLTSHPT
jgi:hypothetical protein